MILSPTTATPSREARLRREPTPGQGHAVSSSDVRTGSDRVGQGQLKKPRVLGLDLSLTCTGIAGDGWTDTLKPGDRRGADRLIWVREQLADRWLAGVDLVAVEGPSYGNQGNGRQSGHHERAGLWWLVRVALASRGIPTAVITPAQLKLYATGKGTADKAAVMLAVARRFPWFEGGEDEADALVLAAMAADHLGTPLAEMPQAHRAALAKVDWPEVTR